MVSEVDRIKRLHPRIEVNRDKRHAILVLGMHRSGTSAIARILNLLGPANPITNIRASH